jgi:prepilin-type N-terminal cleavage/methylation domain-containing protein/prepilin-type processing-associated H-X9-DG protein
MRKSNSRIHIFKKGFTLIELLVVIAIIALLMSILMPALRRVREQARQKSCAARVRQQILSLNLYANDYDFKLPVLRSETGWLQNLTVTAANHMLDSGMTREMFFCPSNESHKKYSMIVWLHHLTEDPSEFDMYWNGSKFINYDEGDRTIAGYFFILDLEGRNRKPIIKYDSDGEDKIWLYNTQTPRPSARELVTDITMGISANNTRYGYQFGHINIGGLSRSNVYDTTSHLKNDEEPVGFNVGFLDGHVEWRSWNPPKTPPVDSNGKPIPRRAGNGPDCFW